MIGALRGEIRVRLEFRQQHSKFESDPNFARPPEGFRADCLRHAQYLIEHPYGVVLAMLTGLPATASLNAART